MTVSIPTWNRAELLSELLEDLCRQIVKHKLEADIELLVSNNNSDDHTENIVKKYQDSFRFVSYNRNEINIGANKNVMKSMLLASSAFVMVLGDDDRIHDGALTRIVNFLKENKDAGLVLDVSNFKRLLNRSKQEIRITDLFEKFYWNIGNAGVFVTRSEFVRDAIHSFGADFFNECWSQTQMIMIGLDRDRSRKIFLEHLKVISKSLNEEVMLYNSYYLWRGTFYELFLAAESIKQKVSSDVYRAARFYLRHSVVQVLFNVLQCGIFVDSDDERKKTISHIKRNINLFTVYERLYLEIILLALLIPNVISRSISDVFIFTLKGKSGIQRKNSFVQNEIIKRRVAAQNSKVVRALVFEN